MPDWILCDCPSCGNTVRFRTREAVAGALCPICRSALQIAGKEPGTTHAPITGRGDKSGGHEDPEDLGHEKAIGEVHGKNPVPGDGTFSMKRKWFGGDTRVDVSKLRKITWSEEDSSGFAPDRVSGPTLVPAPEESGDAKDAGNDRGRLKRKRRLATRADGFAWEAGKRQATRRDRSGIRIPAALAAVLLLGLLLLFAMIFTSSGRTSGQAANHATEGPPVPLPVPRAGDPPASVSIQESRRKQPEVMLSQVVQVVEKFLKAPDRNSRLAMVRDATRVRPLMDIYYSANPDGPVPFISVGADGQLACRDNLLVVKALMKNYEERQVAVESLNGGFLVDWESFVGFCELPPAEFRARRPAHPVVMRVRVAAADPPYFNYAFSDERNLECFVLTFPNESYVFGYTSSLTPIARKMRDLLARGHSVPAVLALRYPEGAETGDQVWIDQQLAAGWVLPESPAPPHPNP